MRLRLLIVAPFLAVLACLSPVTLADDQPAAGGQPAIKDQPAVEAQPDPEVKQAAHALIEEVLRLSHASQIFDDLRGTLSKVYIPAVRDLVVGNTPGIVAPDEKTAEKLAKLLTFLDYVRKAGDELDVALSENREAMISDAASQIAKTAKIADIDDIRATLKLPAVTKGLDALYAITKLLTGFSYEDSRTFTAFTAWADRQNLDLQLALPGMPRNGADVVPPKQRIAKAQALVNDLMSISHIDEMVADANRFVGEVYAETAPIPETERQELRDQAQQFEFLYNVQKAVVLAAAPSVIAATLNDEQLAVVHGFVRSPAFAKLFGLLRNAVKAGTAFTKEDILEAQKSFENLDNKAKARDGSQAEQDRARAEWDALTEKWKEILKNRISPETREGLDRSLEELKDEGAPI
jgi:hypothetical protein